MSKIEPTESTEEAREYADEIYSYYRKMSPIEKKDLYTYKGDSAIIVSLRYVVKLCDIIDRLTAALKAKDEEIETLKRLCGEIQHFYAGVGTILDAEHIRKAYNDSSTKAEIDEVLKG